MVYLDLNAEILPHKMKEFTQSKISFIEKVQKIEGYTGFKERPDLPFKMKIGWKNKRSLSAFMKTELYRFFHGAIITLSTSNSIEVTNDTKANDFTNF